MLAIVGFVACSHQVKQKNQVDTLVKNSKLKKAERVARDLALNSKDPNEIVRSTRTILAANGVAAGTAASILAVLLARDFKVKPETDAIAEKVFTLVSKTQLHGVGARDSLRDVSGLLTSAIERVEDPMGKERLVLELIAVNLLLMGGTIGVLADKFLAIQEITSDREGFALLSELIQGRELRDLDLAFANIAQNVDGVGKFYRDKLRRVLPEHGLVFSLEAGKLNSHIAKMDPLTEVAIARFSSALPNSKVVTENLERLQSRLKEASEYRFRFATKLFYLDPGEPKPIHRFLNDVVSELALEPMTKYLTAVNKQFLDDWYGKIISGEWSGGELHTQIINNEELAAMLDLARVPRKSFYLVTKYFALIDFKRVVRYLLDANDTAASLGAGDREGGEVEIDRGIENVFDDDSVQELHEVVAKLEARRSRLQVVHDGQQARITELQEAQVEIDSFLVKRIAAREALVDAKEEYRARKDHKGFADAHRQLQPILEEVQTLWANQRRIWVQADDVRRFQIDLEGRLMTIDERLRKARDLLAKASRP